MLVDWIQQHRYSTFSAFISCSLLSDTTYFTSLVVQNFCGVDTATLDIIAMPQPVSRFGPSSGVGCSSGTITFANNSYGLPDTYWWDYGDGNNGSSSDTLSTHYYPPTGANNFLWLPWLLLMSVEQIPLNKT